MRTLVIGAGYSGKHIARYAAQHGQVHATCRTSHGVSQLALHGINASVLDGELSDALVSELAVATHIIICVAPDRAPPLHDPIHSLLSKLSASDFPALQWIGYLSTIGVYGNHQGRWVDESSACLSQQARSLMRLEAENVWRMFADKLNIPLSILRLSGIYGPQRNAIEDAVNGKGRILLKRHQVFNRIHVEDLAGASLQAALKRFNGILNITDDVPAPPQDVVRYAHALSQRDAPIPRDFETAEISPMARSFYSENKRVLNNASKRILDFTYTYPNYRQGLASLWNEHYEGFKT